MIKRTPNIQMELLHTITISKGEFTFPQISILKVVNSSKTYYFVLQHRKGKYPSKNLLVENSFAKEDFIGEKYTLSKIKPLISAFQSWEDNKSGCFMGYTYLYAYCKALGKDLHKDYNIM